MTTASTRSSILSRLQLDQAAIGLTVRMTRSAEVVRLARSTRHDFVRIDLQHSLLGVETVAAIAQSGLACGVDVIVRVHGVDDDRVGALLDAGVSGVVFPDVETADDARRAVAAARFPPRGSRSYGGGYPQFDYLARPARDAMAQLDADTVVVCMVESEAGLADAEAIAAVDGVDVVHLGLSDYLTSLGLTGRIDHPAADAAVDHVVSATQRHASYPGLGGSPSPEHQAAALARGIRFLTTQNDVNFLQQGALAWQQRLAQLRGSEPG